MPVPPLDLLKQHAPIRAEIGRAIDTVLDSGRYVLGPVVEQFEANLAAYCGAKHAIGMSSGTDALLAALMACEIGPGDEVIVPTFTFFATAGVVWRVGATPVFVDVLPDSFNIDPDAVEHAVTERTKAIIPVHLFGRCADMDRLMSIAHRRGLLVIEDAAQAIGARYGELQAGGIGHIGCYSFYPTKNLGGIGDSGMVVTNDDSLAARLRQIRVHGQSDLYRHEVVGGNFRIDPIQAAVLDVKLKHLDAYAAARFAAAERYDRLLADLPITRPAIVPGHVFNQYTIRAPSREALRERLRQGGIGHGVYYPLPLHLQPCFASLGCRRGQLPVAETAADEVISLPIYPEITEAQQDEVAGVLRAFYG